MGCNNMDSLEEKMNGRSGTLTLCKFFDVLHLQLPNLSLLISSFLLVLLHGRDPNSVGSAWAGRLMLDWFSHCSSSSCVWCLEQLCRTANCFISLESQMQWIRGSTKVWALPSGYSAENSRYCHWIAQQRLKHGPGFRKWRYDCRWVQSTAQLQKEQFLLHSNTELSEQCLRNTLCSSFSQQLLQSALAHPQQSQRCYPKTEITNSDSRKVFCAW